jgi:preprotein translocase subunit SecB
MTDAVDQTQPFFSIEKIYVKDLSLEIPNAPQIFLERNPPQVDVQLHHVSNKVDEGVYQTELTLTITAKVGDKTMFLVEANQAGIFAVRNVPEQEMAQILGIGNPNILYPYARETVSDAIVRAGFPPVLLNPVNFEALFVAQQQQAAADQAAAPAAAPAPAVTH